MYRIIRRKQLNPDVVMMDIEAPLVSAKAQAGQFVILRVSENGERIPLTIAGTDPEEGSVRIIFQTVGASTNQLSQKDCGDFIHDFVGPLGKPSELDNLKKVCVIGGGVGCAIALPVAQKCKRLGCEVTSIIGFRNKDLVILEDDFRAVSDRFILMTDDGSRGEKGLVTEPLKRMLETGTDFDRIIAIGPLVMMKFVVNTARPFQTPVVVSMNPIMIDGTGMCGGCRLTVNGKMRFACVDGPEFDGYGVDFDEMLSRNRMYTDFEKRRRDESCNLLTRRETE